MSTRVRLNDAALAAVARKLLGAGTALQYSRLERPRAFPTVSAAGPEVVRFLWALSIARLALTDSANSVSLSVAELMRSSSALDAAITEAMPTGFLVRAGGE